MTPLKPYIVACDYPEDGSELVWAPSPDVAEKYAVSHGSLFADLSDDEAEDLTVKELQIIPGTEPVEGTSPHIESRDRVLREYGWRCEGDDRCVTCGLWSMDGAWPVCPHCDQCDDCGHADDCDAARLLGPWVATAGEIGGRLVYIAAPYRGVPGAVHRVGTLSRLLLRLGAVPVSLHAAIDAGHYGSDHDPAQRDAGLAAAVEIAHRIHRAGGLVLAIERDDGGLSEGTRREVEAATGWPRVKSPKGLAIRTWGDIARLLDGREWSEVPR